jgi:hypothetical protein
MRYDIPLTPIDKTAALVCSKGIRADIDSIQYEHHWQAPRPVAPAAVARAFADEDMTGECFGRFTVVGLHTDSLFCVLDSPQWLVRCVCGDYELRDSLQLRERVAKGHEPMCCVCRSLTRLNKQLS